MKEFLKDLQDVFNKHQKTLQPTKHGMIIKDCKEQQYLATDKHINASDVGYRLFIGSQITN